MARRCPDMRVGRYGRDDGHASTLNVPRASTSEKSGGPTGHDKGSWLIVASQKPVPAASHPDEGCRGGPVVRRRSGNEQRSFHCSAACTVAALAAARIASDSRNI